MNDMCEDIEDFVEVEKLGQCFSSVDPLEEIDIGDGITPRPTFVNKNMSLEQKDAIIKLLKEYVDCFALNYREMPGLSRELVKGEVGWLLDAGFILPCRYAEWVSNIVTMKKKNTDKIQVCINFHNLNKATPKTSSN
jgi:hypothetical protein